MAANVRLVFEFLDEISIRPRHQPPIQVPRIVARRVRAILGKLDAEAVIRASMQPVPESLNHGPRAQLEVANRHQNLGIKKSGGGHSSTSGATSRPRAVFR